MEKEIILKEASLKEIKMLPNLYSRCYKTDEQSVNLKFMMQNFKELKDDEFHYFITAIAEKELVGFIAIVLNESIFDAGTVTVYNLMIAPEYQSQGVGKKMMECVEDFARKMGAGKISFVLQDNESENASSFCERCGYKKIRGFIKELK